MKNSMFGLSLLAVLFVAGCHGFYHDNHPHDGNFCPPGQAKKGNC